MTDRLRDKVALVTGAGSGIGRAVAQRLAEEGAEVIVTSRTPSKVEETCAQIERTCGRRPTGLSVDVTEQESLESAIGEIVRRHGSIDVVSNNAGIDLVNLPSVAETSDADWAEVMDVNVTGIFRVCRAVIPHLRAGASVVNMASMLSLVAAAGEASYAASKGALLQFSRVMALELAPRGVRVNCVCPGIIDTPMTDAFLELSPDPEGLRAEYAAVAPMNRLGTAVEVANCVVFLASDEASFVTGTSIVVDGGTTAQ